MCRVHSYRTKHKFSFHLFVSVFELNRSLVNKEFASACTDIPSCLVTAGMLWAQWPDVGLGFGNLWHSGCQPLPFPVAHFFLLWKGDSNYLLRRPTWPDSLVHVKPCHKRKRKAERGWFALYTSLQQLSPLEQLRIQLLHPCTKIHLWGCCVSACPSTA